MPCPDFLSCEYLLKPHKRNKTLMQIRHQSGCPEGAQNRASRFDYQVSLEVAFGNAGDSLSLVNWQRCVRIFLLG
jgi:hypothetical protein